MNTTLFSQKAKIFGKKNTTLLHDLRFSAPISKISNGATLSTTKTIEGELFRTQYYMAERVAQDMSTMTKDVKNLFMKARDDLR